MKSKTFPLLIFVIFIIVFLVFYKGLKNSNIYTPEKNFEKNIPSFEGKKFASKNVINSNEIFYKDDYYLLNIWASWCLPCREEHPYLLKLKKNSFIKIIGINYKDKKDNALKFLDEFENPYFTILNDQNGTASIEIGAYGVPESLILNKEKKIIKKIIGPIDKKKFNEIKKLLKNEN